MLKGELKAKFRRHLARYLHHVKGGSQLEPYLPLNPLLGGTDQPSNPAATQKALEELHAYLHQINHQDHKAQRILACVTSQIKQVTLELYEESKSNQMVSPTLGNYLGSLIRLINPTRVLELGTFTGYSTQYLMFGMSPQLYGTQVPSPLPKFTKPSNLPIDTKLQLPLTEGEPYLLTCSVDKPALEIAAYYLHLSKPPGVKVSLVMMDADKLLGQLPKGYGFDFIFLDCNKSAYLKFYDTIISKQLLTPRGMMVVDNVLFHGQVAALNATNPSVPIKPRYLNLVKKMHKFNRSVSQDPRTLSQLLPIFDGLMVIQRADY